MKGRLNMCGRYIPYYDSRNIIIDESDCDPKLGERLDRSDFIEFISKYVKDNHDYCLAIYTIHNCGFSKRSFIRHIKKRGLKPYIKICRIDRSCRKVIGTCRIYIHKPEYLTGYNENMILTDTEIEKLIEVLNSTDHMSEELGRSETVWQHIIECINDSFKYSSNIKYHIPRNLSMPDYNELKIYNN
jgi:hypothetical protein